MARGQTGQCHCNGAYNGYGGITLSIMEGAASWEIDNIYMTSFPRAFGMFSELGEFNASISNSSFVHNGWSNPQLNDVFGAAHSADGGVLGQNSITITSCTFYDNQALQGGALMLQSVSTVTISNSSFTHNLATGGLSVCETNGGGAIAIVGPSTLRLQSGTTFAFNSATQADYFQSAVGGAIECCAYYNDSETNPNNVTVIADTTVNFTNNYATGDEFSNMVCLNNPFWHNNSLPMCNFIGPLSDNVCGYPNIRNAVWYTTGGIVLLLILLVLTADWLVRRRRRAQYELVT